MGGFEDAAIYCDKADMAKLLNRVLRERELWLLPVLAEVFVGRLDVARMRRADQSSYWCMGRHRSPDRPVLAIVDDHGELPGPLCWWEALGVLRGARTVIVSDGTDRDAAYKRAAAEAVQSGGVVLVDCSPCDAPTWRGLADRRRVPPAGATADKQTAAAPPPAPGPGATPPGLAWAG